MLDWVDVRFDNYSESVRDGGRLGTEVSNVDTKMEVGGTVFSLIH